MTNPEFLDKLCVPHFITLILLRTVVNDFLGDHCIILLKVLIFLSRAIKTEASTITDSGIR